LGWTVLERQARIYIRRAYKALKSAGALDRHYYLNQSLSRLNNLYETAIAKEHYKFAAELESKKQDLLSLKEYNNKEFVTNIAGVVDFKFEEIDMSKYKDTPDKDEKPDGSK